MAAPAWVLAAVPPRAKPSSPLEILFALVVSVEQDGAAFDRLPQAGCDDEGTPEVEIALIHRLETAA